MTDFERKLAALSPAAVDRDALLFAAGRASAPSCRRWGWVCGLLAVTQAATLAALLADRPAPPPAPPEPPAATLPPAPPPDPSSYLALRRSWDAPPPAPPAAAGPDAPPLTAGSRSF